MTIADNKKAFFDYFIEERYEAGMALEGWEVKAIRANRAQIKEGYVVIRNAELFLIGAHISPLQSASTHVNPDPVSPANCCCTPKRSRSSSARWSSAATRSFRSTCTTRVAA